MQEGRLHDKNAVIQFNKIDGILDRTSFMGPYKFSADGLPLNPCGRTGLITFRVRWKTDESGNRCYDPSTKHPILQFVSIRRKDSGEWAIPGVSYSALFLLLLLVSCTHSYRIVVCANSFNQNVIKIM
ncbi:unnamed protein product [Trichobilharzia regenti]|nr:unnamed protein product [Trichobilharzia regenti]